MVAVGDCVHVFGPRLDEYEATVVRVWGNKVIDADVPAQGIYYSLGYMPWPEAFTWHRPEDRHVPIEVFAAIACRA